MLMKRLLAFGVGLLMLIPTIPVYAGTFTDLKDAEWAESYIEKMAAKGIVAGYNGQYKPADPVNKYSAVVMIYRTLKAAGKVDDATVNAAVSKYASVLSSNKVPSWPDLHQAVAWMLENGVIQQDELKYFMSGDAHINARRYELSIFLGKALNVFLKENVNTFISLSFKDASLISSGSAPYVNLLVNKKIIAGDIDGNFKPYDPMTRAAMAKVLSVSYDLVSSTSVVPTVPTPPVVAPPVVEKKTTVKEGTITYLVPSSTKFIFASKEDASKSDIIIIESGVKVYRDGILRDYNALTKDLTVKLTYEDNKLIRVDSGSQLNAGEVTIQSIEDKGGYFILNVTDSENREKRYFTNNTLKTVSLDGVQKPISSLKSGDMAQIKVDGVGLILEISARVKNRNNDGIFTGQTLLLGKPQISIRTDAGEAISLELSSELTVRRNDKTIALLELVPGDYIKIRTYGDKVTSIDAYSISKKSVSGYISGLTFSKTNKIAFDLDDSTKKEYDVAPAAVITLDGKSSDIYSLRVNYRVDIETEGNSIVKLTAKKTASKDQLSGVVVKVYKDLNIITVRTNSGGASQLMSITYNYNTKVISSTGGSITTSYIEPDKSIFVYGNSQDNFFLADKILMLD